MKRKIEVFDYAKEIIKATRGGVLLNTKADKLNTMAIGWGSLGIEWNLPIFTVYVRDSRYTYDQLGKNPNFTISVPWDRVDRKIIGQAGSLTGWKTDKIEAMGLTIEEAEINGVPGFKEFPLTLECKVIYQKNQPIDEINGAGVDSFYDRESTDPYASRNNSSHTEFIGQIVAAYIIEE